MINQATKPVAFQPTCPSDSDLREGGALQSQESQSDQIAIVGPCAAGKTTLAQALQARGYDARQIAQEHSYVPNMWQEITNPDILIYLDVSYPVSMQRKRLNWTEAEFIEQLQRLQHARTHCDILIETDNLNPGQVLHQALSQL